MGGEACGGVASREEISISPLWGRSTLRPHRGEVKENSKWK